MIADFRYFTQRLYASFGVLNNFVLILLIIFKSPKNLGNYKYLMVYISIFELFYSILDFLAVPEIFSSNSAFLIVINSNLTPLPRILMFAASVAFCSLFGMSMAIFAIHFVYRYLVITGYVVCLLIGPNANSDSFMRQTYLLPRHLDLSEICYVGAHFYQIDERGADVVNWKTAAALLLMTIVILISVSIVFLFGHQIYTRMTSMMCSSSKSHKSLQSQLFWALVFQTLIPVILMHIPATIGFFFSMFNRSSEVVGRIATVTIFLYPALDPLPNFFIIQSFRRAILDLFGFVKRPTSLNASRNPEIS
ncbi:unnamed protein product [Caenorhabditis sp. 36 PRJEB53466]|nr:unnamed protein product [Caenorhabditis sp. 36 PRJEB53466]